MQQCTCTSVNFRCVPENRSQVCDVIYQLEATPERSSCCLGGWWPWRRQRTLARRAHTRIGTVIDGTQPSTRARVVRSYPLRAGLAGRRRVGARRHGNGAWRSSGRVAGNLHVEDARHLFELGASFALEVDEVGKQTEAGQRRAHAETDDVAKRWRRRLRL